jgi:hypothetical protein
LLGNVTAANCRTPNAHDMAKETITYKFSGAVYDIFLLENRWGGLYDLSAKGTIVVDRVMDRHSCLAHKYVCTNLYLVTRRSQHSIVKKPLNI